MSIYLKTGTKNNNIIIKLEKEELIQKQKRKSRTTLKSNTYIYLFNNNIII